MLADEYAGHNPVKAAKQFEPDIIGFSSATAQYFRATQLASRIREFSKAPLVIGGLQPTALPAQVIKEGYFDIAVVSEAERSFTALVETLCASGSSLEEYALREIPGIAFRSNGTVSVTAPPGLIATHTRPPSGTTWSRWSSTTCDTPDPSTVNSTFITRCSGLNGSITATSSGNPVGASGISSRRPTAARPVRSVIGSVIRCSQSPSSRSMRTAISVCASACAAPASGPNCVAASASVSGRSIPACALSTVGSGSASSSSSRRK
ncbi:MAG: cobalamin-dependent protein [Armatimonadota bacterium]